MLLIKGVSREVWLVLSAEDKLVEVSRLLRRIVSIVCAIPVNEDIDIFTLGKEAYGCGAIDESLFYKICRLGVINNYHVMIDHRILDEIYSEVKRIYAKLAMLFGA